MGMLFLTRFTGRGMWYLFLSTASWVVLYDSGICTFLGVIITMYVFLLGVASLAKGYLLSRKLHDVRGMIQNQQARFQPKANMNKDAFRSMLQAATNSTPFTEADLDYV